MALATVKNRNAIEREKGLKERVVFYEHLARRSQLTH